MDRYGKSLSDIKNIKQSFFDDNEKLLSNQLEIAKIYNQQPIRSRCKCCKADLLDSLHYESHGVEYAVCGSCGHINGLHQETEEFTHFLYAESDYGKYVYASQQDQRKYDDRIAKIYAPKSGFLLETMSEMSEPVGAIDILDIGAGAGYLVSANDDLGMHTVGIDMSKQQVEYGNLYLHNKECNSRLEVIEGDALVGRIGSFLGNIVTAIGVLEHVIDFHEILRAIKDNKHIRYLFFSVPTYGLSNFLEAVFPKVFNRHLGGVHTHLFTTDSINYLCAKYDMKIVSKWRFGADMMDLYRSLMVETPMELHEEITNKLFPCIDEMQLALDKNDFSSEIHLIVKTQP